MQGMKIDLRIWDAGLEPFFGSGLPRITRLVFPVRVSLVDFRDCRVRRLLERPCRQRKTERHKRQQAPQGQIVRTIHRGNRPNHTSIAAIDKWLSDMEQGRGAVIGKIGQNLRAKIAWLARNERHPSAG